MIQPAVPPYFPEPPGHFLKAHSDALVTITADATGQAYWASVLPDHCSTGDSGVIFGEAVMSAHTVPDSLAAFYLPYSSPSTPLLLKVSIL